MSYQETLARLELNSPTVYEETVRILCKIANNILQNPRNLKIRTLNKSNATISSKILSVNGGKECLELMGFEETNTCFILNENIPLQRIEDFKKAFLSRNKKMELKPNLNVTNSAVNAPNISTNNRIQPEDIIKKINVPSLKVDYSNPLLRKLQIYTNVVLQYEDQHIQKRVCKLIPIATLEENAAKKLRSLQVHIKKNKLKDPDVSIQDLLILELLQWFKEDFFSWVDSPTCEHCGGDTVMSHMSSNSPLLQYAGRVEVHKCKTCNKFTEFARYNDVNILLETRRGRCGEWANTFTLCCRAMGWDARFVVDEGDHVWTEVYSFGQKRWLHCDPCENICDSPLMYEAGWKKKISYVIAFSVEDIQDVTWRYSSDHKEVCKRRKQCTERELLDAIFKIRDNLQNTISQHRKKYLLNRSLMELVEFLTERKANDNENKGRSSGSETWRLARGEIENTSKIEEYIWKINLEDIIGNNVNIRYSSSLNKYEYISGSKTLKEVLEWDKGAYQHESVFRKVEKDWKMVYLTRLEGTEKGMITWKFDLTNSNRKLETVIVHLDHTTYESGSAAIKICTKDTCILLPKGQTSVTSNEFMGSTELTITATLTGGKGDVAWQHAQLFRQSTENMDFNFNVTFIFQ